MRHLLIIINVLFFITAYAQDKSECDKIIISDSLFNAKIDHYGFDRIKSGAYPRSLYIEQIVDINEFVSIENGCLKFQIEYGGGCGTADYKLVSNGVAQKDTNNNIYYEVKLYFIDQDPCKAICHKLLSYDLSVFKTKQIKYVGFNKLIKQK